MFETIRKCTLFAGIEDKELKALLTCLSATRKSYAKNEFIFREGSEAIYVGIVISGSARIIQEDYWGNRLILADVRPSDLFGEAFSCAGTQKLPISVIASEKSDIMSIDYRRIITVCTSSCVFHTQLITNMLRILAEKNILLTRKMEHISKRTIREKLLSFLSAEAAKTQGGIVEIPFNRQELADYLCVDRSALSRELALMQKEGLLQYGKNRFELPRGQNA